MSQALLVQIQKAFTTGTSLSASISVSDNLDQQIQIDPSGNIGLVDTQYGDTRWSFGLRQSLLKNAFGRADRKELKAIGHSEKSASFRVQDEVSQASLKALQKYYELEELLSKYEISKRQLVMRKTRFRLKNRQFKKGLIAKSEILQLEASLLETQEDLLKLERSISELTVYFKVKLALDFGDELFSKVTFRKESTDDVIVLCNSSSKVAHSYSLDSSKSSINAFENHLEAAKHNNKVDVYLTSSLTSNGIDNNTRRALNEASEFQNVEFSVGLGVHISLEIMALLQTTKKH